MGILGIRSWGRACKPGSCWSGIKENVRLFLLSGGPVDLPGHGLARPEIAADHSKPIQGTRVTVFGSVRTQPLAKAPVVPVRASVWASGQNQTRSPSASFTLLQGPGPVQIGLRRDLEEENQLDLNQDRDDGSVPMPMDQPVRLSHGSILSPLLSPRAKDATSDRLSTLQQPQQPRNPL
jgi:hypothetical protein